MDKFLVDLDSVLDELEAKEATNSIKIDSHCNFNSNINNQFDNLAENSKKKEKKFNLDEVQCESSQKINQDCSSLQSISTVHCQDDSKIDTLVNSNSNFFEEVKKEQKLNEKTFNQNLVNEEVNFMSFDSILPDQISFDSCQESNKSKLNLNDDDSQFLNQKIEMTSALLIDDKLESKNLKPLSFDNCQVDNVNEEEMNQYLKDIESSNQDSMDSNVETKESYDLLLSNQCLSSGSTLPEFKSVSNSSPASVASFSSLCSSSLSNNLIQSSELNETSLENNCFKPSSPFNLNLPNSLTLSSPSSSSSPPEMSNSISSSFCSQPSNHLESANKENSKSGLFTQSLEVEETGEEDNDRETPLIGLYQPFWIPDNEAMICMLCDAKFTVIKRRHHCRACGKVLCSLCCSSKAKIPYMSYKEARVCYICLSLLTKKENSIYKNDSVNAFTSRDENVGDRSFNSSLTSNFVSEVNNGNGEGGGVIVGGNLVSKPEPSLSNLPCLKPTSVLKKGPKPKSSEPKQVIFFDGIRPGRDLTNDHLGNFYFKQRSPKKIKSPTFENLLSPSISSKCNLKSNRIIIDDSNGQLSPVINNLQLEADPSIKNLLSVLKDENLPPVSFYLTKNLTILIKCVKLDCCLFNECWTFTSQGLVSVGQDEIVFVLEKISEETTIPREFFRIYTNIYDSASRGLPFSDLSHILYPDGLFGNKDNCGFIFIRPTFQCLKKITLPSPPFLIGILLNKCEIPWVKVFPLRLITKLGADYKTYPCPIVSFRQRKPCFFEIGHTIMNILADFRNYQYSLPIISGLTILLSEKKTIVNFPQNRYEKVMKALSSSNEYVLPFGGNLSLDASSHLTCIQNDDGQYHTHTIHLPNSNQTYTGASFIVFSGALKSPSGVMAKMNTVEDGLLVQMSSNLLNQLKLALNEMKDFKFDCVTKDNPQPEESIELIWTKDDISFNVGVKSCIDGTSLEGVYSVRMYNHIDYESDNYLIRWTELFLIQMSENARSKGDGADSVRLAEIIARSLCLALAPKLELLVDENIIKIGLRVSLSLDKFGYDVGSNQSPLPANYINILDEALIPAIMEKIAPNVEDTLVMELIFYILNK